MISGQKFDSDKPDVGLVFEDFPRALLEVAKVATFGTEKYARHNWLTVENAEQRYASALGRHILKHAKGEILDDDSELPHLAHAAWNALAVLELFLLHEETKRKS